MAIFKKNFSILLFTILCIFLISFVGSGIYYFIAIGDDKLYDDENKYIDDTLTGSSLTHESNLNSAYKINDNTNSWFFIVMKFLKLLLKIILIITLPLAIYFFFIDKDNSIMYYLKKII